MAEKMEGGARPRASGALPKRPMASRRLEKACLLCVSRRNCCCAVCAAAVCVHTMLVLSRRGCRSWQPRRARQPSLRLLLLLLAGCAALLRLLRLLRLGCGLDLPLRPIAG